MTNKKKNQKKKHFLGGSIAVFTLFLMFILTVVTISIITTSATERRVSISTSNSTTAFQIVESGMEKTAQYFKSNFDKKLSDVNGPTNCLNGVVKYDSNSLSTVRFKDNAATPAPITSCDALISSVKIIKSIGTTKQETRAAEQDVFLGATKLLLHLNGCITESNVCTKFIPDSSYYYYKYTNPNKIELKGEAKVSTNLADPKLSAAFSNNAKFTGVADDYIAVANPGDGDWDLETGSFTIDFWVYPDGAFAGNNTYIEMGSASNAIIIRQDNPAQLRVNIMGDFSQTYSVAPAVGNWSHIAVVRKKDTGSNELRVFVNGNQIGTDQNINSDIQISGDMKIGPTFKGYIDELRISKGVARWWDDTHFTPPTTEYWPD